MRGDEAIASERMKSLRRRLRLKGRRSDAKGTQLTQSTNSQASDDNEGIDDLTNCSPP